MPHVMPTASERMATLCDLSLVIELDTKEITGRGGFLERLGGWVAQLREMEPLNTELILCGAENFELPAEIEDGLTVRRLVVPETGYYGFKNAGARAALGKIVLFTDSDCRPRPGALRELLAAFRDPRVKCVHGRTFYDGADTLALINTVWSFGYVHHGETLVFPATPLTHVVALRRGAIEGDPFGPFNGRMGGDDHLARILHDKGIPIVLVPGLTVEHEDLSRTVRGTLERHLREHFAAVARVDPEARLRSRRVLRSALGGVRERWRKLRRDGTAVGLRPGQWPLALAMLGFYGLLDLAAVSVVLALPPVKRRWCTYLFGEPLASRLLREETEARCDGPAR